MQSSDAAIGAFLAGARWSEALRAGLAGDASRRRYERLSLEGETAILMIAPPEAGEDTGRFAEIARYLGGNGFSAPHILAEDHRAGFLLLEDLGDALFARLADTDATSEKILYEAAVDFLVSLHDLPPPEVLPAMTPRSLAEAVDPLPIWYCGLGEGQADATLARLVEELVSDLDRLDAVTVLRDFHAENLIWISERSGDRRVGLLDFQDALRGHRAYDLASLLTDARRDMRPGLADAMTERYLARSGLDRAGFRHAFALLAAQRNLRILGIFARLAIDGGKAGYLALLPRVWRHLRNALTAPGLEHLAEHVLRTVPPPDEAHLARLKSR